MNILAALILSFMSIGGVCEEQEPSLPTIHQETYYVREWHCPAKNDIEPLIFQAWQRWCIDGRGAAIFLIEDKTHGISYFLNAFGELQKSDGPVSIFHTYVPPCGV